MIRFAAPEWLLLFPLMLGLLWRWPFFRRPVRVAVLGLLLLLMMGLEWRRREGGLDLWVLADRSASAESSIGVRLPEMLQILERSKRAEDQVRVVDYAEEAILRDTAAGVDLPGGREQTRTGLALQYALSKMSPERANRILVLTDGYATEPLAGAEERLLHQGVPLDYRLGGDLQKGDFRVDAFLLPPRAQPGEPVLIEARVSGPAAGETPYQISCDGRVITRGTVKIAPEVKGRWARGGLIRVTDRQSQPGGHRYEVQLLPAEDPSPGNNRAGGWVEVSGGARVLLVSGYRNDPLAGVLRAQGFEVEVADTPGALNAGRLQGARTVILNNISSAELPRPFLDSLDFFVRVQGGGLLMAGGKASFASGGYFGTSMADLLPISMEQRLDQRKMSVALAIVLDRSGSMGAGVSGGRTKMDLANAGAARAVELLGPMDQVAVFAVDTEPHIVLPLTVLGNSTAALTGRVRSITTGGGGIYVYTGLNAAFEMLKKSPRGQRHIILFADAADAEEPGAYLTLMPEMEREGITVSVIGMGTEGDSDAAFLKDVAARGKGRIFFTANAEEIPGVFEQETVAIARAVFVDQPVGVVSQAAWGEVAARPLSWLPEVDGYNLSYLRPGASVAALTADEKDPAPLVAFWQREGGRVATVAFPLGGDFSAKVRAWGGYGDFLQTLTRWCMGDATPSGIALRATVEGTELAAELFFDESWEAKLAAEPPRLIISGIGPSSREELVWRRMEPGLFRASKALRPGESVRGVVQVGKAFLPFGPLEAAAGVEWEVNPQRPQELASVSRLSGGSERGDLTTVWSAPRPENYFPLQPWLLGGVLGLFLLDALMVRLGTTGGFKIAAMPRLSMMSKHVPERARASVKETPIAAGAKADEPDQKKPPETAAAGSDRQQRFRRAKRGL